MIGTLYRYSHPHDPTRFIYVGQGPRRDRQHRSGQGSFGRRFKKLFPDDILPEPIKEQIEVSNQLELNEEETIWMFRYHTWRGYPDGMNLVIPGSQDYKEVGRIQGLINAKNKTGVCGRSFEKMSEDGRLGGLVGGKKNVESGHIRNVGLNQGKKNVESGFLDSIRTHDGSVKGGRTQSRIMVENGDWERIKNLPQSIEARSMNGKNQGRKNVESGLWASFQTSEHKARAGAIAGRINCCMRWNIKRGKPCTCGKH